MSAKDFISSAKPGLILVLLLCFWLAPIAHASAQAGHDRKNIESLKEKQGLLQDRANFLNGYINIGVENYSEAIRQLNSISKYDILSDYVEYFSGRAHFFAGDIQAASAYFRMLPKRHPDSVLIASSYYMAAKCAWEANDAASALKYYSFAESRKWALRGPEVVDLNLLLAKIYISQQKYAAAWSRLKSALAKASETPDKIAVLDMMEEMIEDNLVGPREKLYYKKATADFSYSQSEISSALSIYKQLRNEDPGNPEILWRIASCYGRLNDINKKHDTLDRLAAEFKDSDWAPRALYNMGRYYWNKDDLPRAHEYIENLISKYPNHSEWTPDAYYIMGRIYEDMEQVDKALLTYNKGFLKFPRNRTARNAQWRAGWIYYTRGQYKEAAEIFGSIAPHTELSYDWGRTLYWQGRALERTGNTGKAYQVFLRICSGQKHDYYGHLARYRLAFYKPHLGPPPDVSLFEFGPRDQKSPLDSLSYDVSGASLPPKFNVHLDKIAELNDLGLNWELDREFGWLKRNAGKDFTRHYFIAKYYRLCKEHQNSMIRAEITENMLSQNDEESLRQAAAHLKYPLPYWSEVERFSRLNFFDPILIASIIRQESGFDADSRSWAGAAGLMQIIPSTGRQIARGIKFEKFHPSILYDPETSISFGSLYLAQMISKFDGNLVHALAAYNAGPHRVSRWLKEYPGLDNEEFVESIPFPETKNYVKRIIRNRGNYYLLYDKDPFSHRY